MTWCKFIADESNPLHKECRKCKRQLFTPDPPEKCFAQCRKGIKAGSDTSQPIALRFDDLPCIHRGEVTGVAKCDICALRGKQMPIATCALFGSCVPRRYSKGGMKEANCAMCKDRSEPAH